MIYARLCARYPCMASDTFQDSKLTRNSKDSKYRKSLYGEPSAGGGLVAFSLLFSLPPPPSPHIHKEVNHACTPAKTYIQMQARAPVRTPERALTSTQQNTQTRAHVCVSVYCTEGGREGKQKERGRVVGREGGRESGGWGLGAILVWRALGWWRGRHGSPPWARSQWREGRGTGARGALRQEQKGQEQGTQTEIQMDGKTDGDHGAALARNRRRVCERGEPARAVGRMLLGTRRRCRAGSRTAGRKDRCGPGGRVRARKT